MLDFLFITSPSYASNPHPPYYFMYLAAHLRQKGLSIKIVDVKGGDTPEDIDKHLDEIKKYLLLNKSRFIGLSAFHNDYPMIMKLGKIVRFLQKNTILLVGNAHATINPEDFIYEGSPFDFAVLGEGELTCGELYKMIIPENARNDMRPSIKGIAFLNNGQIFKTEPRPFLDLKKITMPAYDLIDMNWYLKPQKLIIRRIYTSVIPIYAGRGCAWHCFFCSANTVWKANKGKPVRLRPVDDVLREISFLKGRYGLDFFYMFDDTFGVSKEWMEEWFFKKKLYIGDMPYACQTRANLIDKTMARGLKESGCIQVDIGVESGSQKLLDRIHKHITVQQIRRAVDLLIQNKLRYFFTMLLNLPGETEEDLKESQQLLKELKPNGVIFGITTPYPGTKIYSEYCPQGLKKNEYHLLTGNRLDPLEQFRMAEHKLDLWQLWDKWNMKYKATPLFERMWPGQFLYWQAVVKSPRIWQYVQCWGKDIFKTAFIWLFRKLNIYRWLKRVQYKKV